VLDLLYAEVLLRKEQGERPDLAEYLGRFPAYAAALRRQFELHRALALSPLLEPSDTPFATRERQNCPGSDGGPAG
jgi:hypothetical protein